MLISRAEVHDVMTWASMSRRNGSPLPGKVYKCLLAQVAVSEAYTLRETESGDPVVIAGCTDLAPGAAGEIFFMGPNGGLGRRLVRVHRLALNWLKEAAAKRPAGLVCFVRVGNRQGARLARALGFAPGGIFDGYQEWRRTQ